MTSDETRTLETADIFSRHLGVPVEIDRELRDISRPKGEFLPVAAFQETMEAFFARPGESARPGWEPALTAQARLARAFAAQIGCQEARRDVLIVGHGAAGTLLLCDRGGTPISRDCFEPTGGGNLFAVDCRTGKLLFRWRSVAPPR